MKRLVVILLLIGSFLTPVVTFAEEHRRYYDRDRRDWHEWNEHENRAYRHWLMEEAGVERRYREYRRNKRPAASVSIGRWRHEHGDWR